MEGCRLGRLYRMDRSVGRALEKSGNSSRKVDGERRLRLLIFNERFVRLQDRDLRIIIQLFNQYASDMTHKLLVTIMFFPTFDRDIITAAH